jgi:hypothetical protein
MEPKENLKKYLVLRDSIQDIRVNQILDKILIGRKLTKEENAFLDKLEHVIDYKIKDYLYLSKNMCVELISDLMARNFKIICDLTDRNGKLSESIIKIENNFEEDCCILHLEKGETANLYEKFLYNLNYNVKKNHYVLTIQDEYFEKITIDKNED